MPLDIWLMQAKGWSWQQIQETPNAVIQEVLAAQRLEDERVARASKG